MIKKMLAVVLLCWLQSTEFLFGMEECHRGDVEMGVDVVVGSIAVDGIPCCDIDNIPDLCLYLMFCLFNQPAIDSDSAGSGAEICKGLCFGCLNDGEICAILSRNLEQSLDVYAYHNDAEDPTKRINTLFFWLPRCCDFSVLFDVDALKIGYQQVVEKIKTGWIYIPSEVSSSIFDGQLNSDEWFVFIKEKRLKDEARLIMQFAEKFCLAGLVRARDNDMYHENVVYLWIKKDSIESVIARFKFRLNIEPIDEAVSGLKVNG